MKIETTALVGVLIITPARHGDARGFFSESWNQKRMQDAQIDLDFVQDNHSLSMQTNTLRGLHYQTPPHAQAKLVRCGRGRLLDVAVDIRKGSPTFGQHIGVELSFENGKQLLIPAGFAHGFVTREDETEIVYKCSDYYSPDCDRALHWNSCDIDWELTSDPILSDKDNAAEGLDALDSMFIWKAQP